MDKIVILNQKLIVPDNYQQFWLHFEWFLQGVKVGMLGRQTERNCSFLRLAHTSIFGLCFMPVCLIISNCYSLIYSSSIKLLFILLFYFSLPNTSINFHLQLIEFC